MYTDRIYWIIEMGIDGETNYYCGFRRHPANPTIFGIEWDTDIIFAKVFDSEIQAQLGLQSIIKYDPRTPARIVEIPGKVLNNEVKNLRIDRN